MNYIIWANIYLVCFYGFYWFFMRKETFFELNRWYLMTTMLLAFCIPLLDLKGYLWAPKVELLSAAIDFEAQVTQAISGVEKSNPSWFDSMSALPMLALVYMVGCLFFLINLIVQLVTIRKGLRAPNTGQAYSFFHRIHVDSSISNYSKVLEHERVHVSQFHSVDVLFIEIVKIFNWFNPVVYLMERSAKLNHEYIADERTASNGRERILYAESLLNQAFDATHFSLKNNFINESFIKNRITMLFKNKSKKLVLSRFLILVPMLLVLISFQSKEQNFMEVTPSDVNVLIPSSIDSEELFYQQDTIVGSNVPLTNPEVQPQPPGGMMAFLKRIGNEYKVSKEAVAAKISGRLITTFIVEKDGTLSDVKVIHDLGYGTGDEALRVLKNSPKWSPGIQDGKAVRVQYTLPIVVQLGSAPRSLDSSSTSSGRAETSPRSQNSDSSHSNEPVFESLDVQPTAPGGMMSYLKFIGENYKYPKEAEEAKVMGRVITSFVVETDGTLSDVKIVRDLGHGTGEEAVRVIQNSEKWEPGYLNGQAVRVQYTLPIVLNLSIEEK